MAAPVFHAVARTAELTSGEVLHLELAGHEIALFNIEGEFFATSDRCTHMRARLSDGYVQAGVVECPLHFGKFDIRTGRALSPPCKLDLATYPVEVRGDAVWVGLSA
jgi:nitrite reductase/ring-hydroxylating ferredoxin subunit